jgi:hypothetical protein
MNTKRTIYEKINSISPKVELAQVDVYLNAIDDFNNAEEMVNEYYGRGANKAKESLKPLRDAINEIESGLSYFEKVVKIGMGVEKQIKDLGLDLPTKYTSSKDRLFKNETKLKQAKAKLQDVLSSINF